MLGNKRSQEYRARADATGADEEHMAKAGNAFPDEGGRRLLIAGNWKMNKCYSDAVNLVQEIDDLLRPQWKRKLDIVVCPPYTALRGVSNVIAFDHSFVRVGAQNCCVEPQGAFTGQISIDMLTDLDCTYCIVGHSECREHLCETSELVSEKASALERANVTPIVCVGEDQATYESGGTQDHIVSQVAASLANVQVGSAGLAVAYEPIWAIGTGTVPAPDFVQRVARTIRTQLESMFGSAIAQKTRLLYGGSVKPGNVAAFVSCADIDGVLIGGASLKADDFCSIISNAHDAVYGKL